MREINMQKTVRNASNLHAKNTAKCVTFLQIFLKKKTLKMRQISMQKHREIHFAFRIVFCILISRISHCFLHINFTHFALFFAY